MTIDTITLILCAALGLLTVLAIVANPLWRRPVPPKESDTTDSEALPPLSVVITVHDNAQELERNLPVLLSQDYAAGYEVIVVDESSHDDTADVLKRLRLAHPNLYTTFIPESSHYLSRRKLALTVGVKAAHHEWIVFTDADCRPDTDQWLTAMGSHCQSSCDMVMGYTRLSAESPARWRYDHLVNQWRCMGKARKTAYRYNGHSLALRKSVFIAHNGFLGNLKYLRGEYDFLVNEYAVSGRTDIALEPQAHVTQDVPSRRSWTNSHLFYMETRRHLMRSLAYRLPNILCHTLFHLTFVVLIAAIACVAVFSRWIELAVASVCLIVLYGVRSWTARRAFKPLGEHLPWVLLPLFELTMAWQWLAFRLRHARADKYDFIRK